MRERFKNRWVMAGGAVLAVVFVVGLVTVVQQTGAELPNLAKGVAKGKTASSKTGALTSINRANFDYLAPGKDDSWVFDPKSVGYEKDRGVVQYKMQLKYMAVDVTFSQQQLPDELKDQRGPQFMKFINDSKVTREQAAGDGKIYFLPALENGQQANGSDTIIYATKDILMFGRSGSVVRPEVWAKLLASMTKTHP